MGCRLRTFGPWGAPLAEIQQEGHGPTDTGWTDPRGNTLVFDPVAGVCPQVDEGLRTLAAVSPRYQAVKPVPLILGRAWSTWTLGLEVPVGEIRHPDDHVNPAGAKQARTKMTDVMTESPSSSADGRPYHHS